VFEDSSQRATREAQNDLYRQTVEAVQTQAPTVIALQATADSAASMATQIVRMNAQNRGLQATIDALAAGLRPPSQNALPAPPAAQPSGQTPVVSNQAFPNAATATPRPALAPAAAGVVYTSPTTASDISNDDGCPLDQNTSFSRQAQRIYIVVQAQNVPAGITYYTRWLYEGETRFETVSWTTDTAYPQICIWFYVTPNDLVFQAGNWSVQLVANEVAVVNQNFVIQ
jgi:hypothetical protein